MLSVLSGAVVVSVGAPLVQLVFGPDFGGLFAVILILVVGQVFEDRYLVDISFFAGVGKPEKIVVPSWTTAVIALVALLILGRDSLTGLEAASVTLGTSIVRCVGVEIISRRLHGSTTKREATA